jgi:hypothetical protein
VAEFGLAGALAHFERLVDVAGRSIPSVSGGRSLAHLLKSEAERLLPASLRARVAA